MLISVIVPVYNVEKYLKRCINSIINQTHKDIEIILIDDGSTDSSGKICDEYSNTDTRIKAIHIQNSGAARARNVGLDIAKGEYISFIDSDDYILPDFLEKLLRLCIDNNAEISKCEVIDFEREDIKITKQSDIKINIYTSNEVLNTIYTDSKLFNVAIMNKLYKRNIFENLRFKEGIINEDEEILCKIILNSNKIVITDEILYCYFLSEGSITRSEFRKKNLDILTALELRLSQLEDEKYKKIYLQTQADYMKKIGNLYYCISISKWEDKDKYLKELNEKRKEIRNKVKKNKYFKTKDEIKLILCFKFKYILNLFYYVKSILSRKD